MFNVVKFPNGDSYIVTQVHSTMDVRGSGPGHINPHYKLKYGRTRYRGGTGSALLGTAMVMLCLFGFAVLTSDDKRR